MSRITLPFFINHQGCPHTCYFCDQRSINGNERALPDNREMAKSIVSWKRTSMGRPLDVAFFGGSFTALPRSVQRQLLASVHPHVQSGDVSSIRISTRPDCLDGETIHWLAKYGVRTIEVGVQSLNDDVLAASGRGHDAAASLHALQRIKAYGLNAGAQLMPGLPGDTPESSRRSVADVIGAGADFIRIYPVVVLQDTQLAHRYLSGVYCPPSLDEGIRYCMTMVREALKTATPVIRIGLQGGDGLREERILAGCWHPALAELVYGELFHELLRRMLGRLGHEKPDIGIYCHPSRVSTVIGHKRRNLTRLRDCAVSGAIVRPDAALSVHDCRIETGEYRVHGSLLDE